MATKHCVQSQASTLELYPATRPASATLTCHKPDGSTLVASTAASVDATSLTVSVVTSQTKLTMASASGLVVGRRYWLDTTNGPGCAVEVAEVDAPTRVVTLVDPPADPVEVGDSLVGLRCSFQLTAENTAHRDTHYRADWLVTPEDGSDVQAYTTPFHVVRMAFRPPCSAESVKRLLAYQWPSSVGRYTTEGLRNIADTASRQVLQIIEGTGRYAHLFGDQDAFQSAGVIAARLALADDGLLPGGGVELLEYQTQLRAQLREECKIAANALQWHDRGDDGSVNPAREVGPFFSRVIL